MKSGFDVVTDVISLINIPEVTDRLTGRIWPFTRPLNSNKTDIVVGMILCNNEWLQEAMVNIRIHSPNIPVTHEGVIDNSQPDHMTFNKLSKLILPLIDDQYRDTFNTEVEDTGEPFRNPDGSWFFRIRVNYYSMQTNYRNI